MKKPKLYVAIIIGLGSFLFLYLHMTNVLGSKKGNNSLKQNEVQLIIKPEYNDYLLNQSVWIEIKILNNSNVDYYLKEVVNPFTLNFDITDPEGKKISKGIIIEPTPITDSIKLSPKSLFEKNLPLDIYMQTLYVTEKKLTGKYEIKAEYQGLQSNIITIDMNLPNSEDKILFDETFGAIYPLSNNEQTLKLENLLRKYPKSKYCTQLYNILLIWTLDGDTTRFLNNMQDFLKYNSNTYGVYFILNQYELFLSQNMKLSSNEISLKMNMLKETYRGTKTEKMIKQKELENLYKK